MFINFWLWFRTVVSSLCVPVGTFENLSVVPSQLAEAIFLCSDQTTAATTIFPSAALPCHGLREPEWQQCAHYMFFEGGINSGSNKLLIASYVLPEGLITNPFLPNSPVSKRFRLSVGSLSLGKCRSTRWHQLRITGFDTVWCLSSFLSQSLSLVSSFTPHLIKLIGLPLTSCFLNYQQFNCQF